MLLDHFRPPLSDRRGWHGFHTQWAGVIAANLNRRLPDGWWAEPEAIFGVEIDVGVVEDAEGAIWTPGPDAELADWEAPQPDVTLEFSVDEESVEIRVLNTGYGPSLMGAVELVSPANKDRPKTREAFTNKCLSILNAGAGLMVVDIVTSRHADIRAELLDRFGVTAPQQPSTLSASAFRVTSNDTGESMLQVWSSPLTLDSRLPTMPLWLRIGPMLAVDLQSTYLETCQQLRIPTPDVVASSTA